MLRISSVVDDLKKIDLVEDIDEPSNTYVDFLIASEYYESWARASIYSNYLTIAIEIKRLNHNKNNANLGDFLLKILNFSNRMRGAALAINRGSSITWKADIHFSDYSLRGLRMKIYEASRFIDDTYSQIEELADGMGIPLNNTRQHYLADRFRDDEDDEDDEWAEVI